ncbi:uncharacterized protein LOC123504528 [Portunus trituberculatus]|uniref:uncharacterized protein LOC123504528 n=1 Tax=Portunus trituberculatus TaxID=210409 RepID=UPI001E1D15C8|nr:uncharacterized protein LOC123504528 [Portunus trituberculatus]
MNTVLSSALSQDPDVRRGTSAYIDDVYVNEDIVTARRVAEHLHRYGLTTKAYERVTEGARVLGLRVWGESGMLLWGRDGKVSGVPTRLTRRTAFSYCGKLTGHFPVCGWLRAAAAYVKRRANAATHTWDDIIVDAGLRSILEEIAGKVLKDDPVRGRWDVGGTEAKVWVDASSLAMGAAVEVEGKIVEDACWLRPDGASHINMAELDAVIKGLNLALAWKMSKVELVTDSSTVHRWINDCLTGRARLKTKAASEMLIRRRLEIVMSLVKECGLVLTVSLVPSSENKADVLTRVPQRWLRTSAANVMEPPPVCAAAVETSLDQLVTDIHHSRGHPGVRRTLYFVKRVNAAVTKGQVRAVVASCQICQSIDPAPVKWSKGNLSVEGIWQRVGMDITHCRGRSYLTLIDCGPSRFTIWRPLRLQTSDNIIEQLEAVFCERGTPDEILTDNDTAFRSKLFAQFALRWNVNMHFRGAYSPSGNGVVERCHRTVKVIAARKGCSIAEAVYLYNITPGNDCSPTSAPANMLYGYSVRVRGEDASRSNPAVENNPHHVGEEVWVKPPGVRCDEQYKEGVVTGVVSDQVAEVDGTPRHVRDLRHRVSPPRHQDRVVGNSDNNCEDLVVTFPTPEEQREEEDPERNGEDVGSVVLRRSARIKQSTRCLLCD